MVNITLSTINARCQREIAKTLGLGWINKQPIFQRSYEAWNDKMKTKLIETILLGRAMNPIWTIFNSTDNSNEILDGMHRITTSINFLNNKFKLKSKFLDESEIPTAECYNNKTFSELSNSDQNKIRNYEFTINMLPESYRQKNKLKIQYELLNRSTITLNDYEFNKVMYSRFYNIINEYKNTFKDFVIHKKDARGGVESEIISCFVLSRDLPSSWSSFSNMTDKYYKNIVGNTETEINTYLNRNENTIRTKLNLMCKIINRLISENLFHKNKKNFTSYYVIYKCFISRLVYKLKNISLFNRHVEDIIAEFKREFIDVNTDTILKKLKCSSRNAKFQKKLINKIDTIIDKHYDATDPKNNRLFSKEMIKKKLECQKGKCAICECALDKKKYEGDHIKKFSAGGKTSWDNLQVLCVPCHNKK